MLEPQWSNARPPHSGDFRCDQWMLPTPELTVAETKYNLLGSKSDATRELTSSKLDKPIELPILSRNGPAHPHYKLIIPRSAHEELETVYMVKHDPVHYQRRYLMWFGIDLDGFGPIDTAERFFEILDLALAAGNIVVQDNTPIEGPLAPKRVLWLALHGYFGNWYSSAERKWPLIAARRHTAILKKLWERGDLRLVSEHLSKDIVTPSASGRKIITCLELDGECRRPQEKFLVFPEILKKRYRMAAEKKSPQVHGCVNS